VKLSEYQDRSAETAIYPGAGTIGGLSYTALGLAGESGEVANKVQKVIRDDGGLVSPEVAGQIASELGGTLWYLAQCAAEIGWSLDDVAALNLAQLRDRQRRGVLGGSGDER
jgi:NTP pyrophosphatase (non-canonical NTP hydrolase)